PTKEITGSSSPSGRYFKTNIRGSLEEPCDTANNALAPSSSSACLSKISTCTSVSLNKSVTLFAKVSGYKSLAGVLTKSLVTFTVSKRSRISSIQSCPFFISFIHTLLVRLFFLFSFIYQKNNRLVKILLLFLESYFFHRLSYMV